MGECFDGHSCCDDSSCSGCGTLEEDIAYNASLAAKLEEVAVKEEVPLEVEANCIDAGFSGCRVDSDCCGSSCFDIRDRGDGRMTGICQHHQAEELTVAAEANCIDAGFSGCRVDAD